MNDEPMTEKLVPLDISDAIALIERQEQVIEKLQEEKQNWIDLYSKAEEEIAEIKRQAKEVEYGTRLFLLLNHGHVAPYTGDGELQCGNCFPNWDYGRLPLKVLINQALALRDEQIAALTANYQDSIDTIVRMADQVAALTAERDKLQEMMKNTSGDNY